MSVARLRLPAWVSTPYARLVGADGSRAEPVILKAGIAGDALGPAGETSVSPTDPLREWPGEPPGSPRDHAPSPAHGAEVAQ
jgi:hypothetical protein